MLLKIFSNDWFKVLYTGIGSRMQIKKAPHRSVRLWAGGRLVDLCGEAQAGPREVDCKCQPLLIGEHLGQQVRALGPRPHELAHVAAQLLQQQLVDDRAPEPAESSPSMVGSSPERRAPAACASQTACLLMNADCAHSASSCSPAHPVSRLTALFAFPRLDHVRPSHSYLNGHHSRF